MMMMMMMILCSAIPHTNTQENYSPCFRKFNSQTAVRNNLKVMRCLNSPQMRSNAVYKIKRKNSGGWGHNIQDNKGKGKVKVKLSLCLF
jgi:hypothetical protein